ITGFETVDLVETARKARPGTRADRTDVPEGLAPGQTPGPHPLSRVRPGNAVALAQVADAVGPRAAPVRVDVAGKGRGTLATGAARGRVRLVRADVALVGDVRVVVVAVGTVGATAKAEAVMVLVDAVRRLRVPLDDQVGVRVFDRTGVHLGPGV